MIMDFEAAYEVKYFYQRFDKQQSSVTIQEGKIRLSGASRAICCGWDRFLSLIRPLAVLYRHPLPVPYNAPVNERKKNWIFLKMSFLWKFDQDRILDRDLPILGGENNQKKDQFYLYLYGLENLEIKDEEERYFKSSN